MRKDIILIISLIFLVTFSILVVSEITFTDDFLNPVDAYDTDEWYAWIDGSGADVTVASSLASMSQSSSGDATIFQMKDSNFSTGLTLNSTLFSSVNGYVGFGIGKYGDGVCEDGGSNCWHTHLKYGYKVRVQDEILTLFKCIEEGACSQLDTYAGSNMGTADAVFMLLLNGTDVNVYRNGSLVMSVAETTYSEGTPYVYAGYHSSQGAPSSWEIDKMSACDSDNCDLLPDNPPVFTNINVTSVLPSGCASSPCVTNDTTPTTSWNTDVNSMCRCGSENQNYTEMGNLRNASTTGFTSHVCTIQPFDVLTDTVSVNPIYFACAANTGGLLNQTSFNIDISGLAGNATGSGIPTSLSVCSSCSGSIDANGKISIELI